MLSISRRKFTQSLSALAASHCVLTQLAFARTQDLAGAKPRRIDVHHHILPPEYIATVGEKAIGAPAPNREVRNGTSRGPSRRWIATA